MSRATASVHSVDHLAHTIEWCASPNDVKHDQEDETVVVHAFLAMRAPLTPGGEHRHAEQVCIATNVMSVDFWKTKKTSGKRCPHCVQILSEALSMSGAPDVPEGGEICLRCNQTTIPGASTCLNRYGDGRCEGKPPEGRQFFRYANGTLSKHEVRCVSGAS